MGQEVSKGAQDVRKCSLYRWLANFHPGYIRRLKERFELAKESYTLERDDLQRLFKCKKEEVEDIFHHFDLDEDEVIDQYEFITALAFVCHGSLDEKAALIFELYDFDKSRYISKDELTILMTNSLTSLRCLTAKAAPSIADVEKKVDEMFSSADTDHNQKITLDEFTGYIKRDAEILSCLFAYGIAKKEDLGANLGTEEEPYYDSDLDNETLLDDLTQDSSRQNTKYGQGLLQFDEYGLPVDDDQDDDQVAKRKRAAVGDSSAVFDADRPDATLDLQYIYGYRCHDARNNLRYNCEGKVVYHAAGVGVVFNQRENTQRFMMQHDDDILCMAVDPSGQYCATGQVGLTPWLVVWDTTGAEKSCVDVVRFKKPLTNGIKHVAFSHDGELLVATGMDSQHSIAVYRWRDEELIAAGKGPLSHVWSIGFSGDDEQVIATCSGEVNFFSFEDGVLTQLEQDEAEGPLGSVLCQAIASRVLYTGTHTGHILAWIGRGAPKANPTGQSAVYCLYSRTSQAGLISGHKDGAVIVWRIEQGALVKVAAVDLKGPEVKSIVPQVKSVCEHPKTQALLVGTRGGEIFEFSGKLAPKQQPEKPKLFLKSHHNNEICGLATHPSKEQFLTVGQDCMLGVWDIRTRRQTRYAKLECGANVVEYSEDGKKIAIGMLNGYLLVVQSDDWAPVAKTQHSMNGQAITAIRFSPDNSACAVGGQDGRIKVYDVESSFRKAQVIKKSLSAVLSIDFSSDSKYFVVNNEAQEVLAFETKTGCYTDGSTLRRPQWHTWSGALGQQVQGIVAAGAEIDEVLACQRSPDGNVIATGDRNGCINLFKFPCPQPDSARSKYVGHSAGVRNLRFTKNGGHLISCGGQDLSIFQWQYRHDKEGLNFAAAAQAAGRDAIDREIDFQSRYHEGQRWTDTEQSEFQMALARVGEQKPPGYAPSASAGLPPLGDISLQHAHGYSSQSIRGNVKVTASGSVVFTLGSLGVVQSPDATQSFFMLHRNQEITSMDIHPERDIVATGARAALGKRAEVLVWRASTQEVLARLGGVHRNAVTALKFSPNGKKLVTVGQDREHALVVYDWANQSVLAATSTGAGKVTAAAWKTEGEFMTVGTSFTMFYTMNGKNLSVRRGHAKGELQRDHCCVYAYESALCLTGNESGDVYEWDGSAKLLRAHRAHDAPVQQLVAVDAKTLASGGLDGRIVLWGPELQKQQAIELTKLTMSKPGVAALDYDAGKKNYIVGTLGAEVFEASAQEVREADIVAGHYSVSDEVGSGKVLALASHPSEQLFVTSGTDRCLRFWSAGKQEAVAADFADDIIAIDWSSCGRFLLIGDARGQLYSVDASSHRPVNKCQHKQKLARKDTPVQAVKIAPNNNQAAFSVAGASGFDLVSVDPSSFQLRHDRVIEVGRSITSIDWSAGSDFLALCSKAALVFCEPRAGKEVPYKQVSQVQWQTWTGKLGFTVQGIWSDQRYSSVTAVATSRSMRYLATAEDSGSLKLFKYPCTVHNAHHHVHQGHGSPVAALAFSAQDKFVVSAGSRDQGVLVWATDFDAGKEQGPDDDDGIVDEQDPDEQEYFTYETDLIDRSRELKQQMKTRRQIEAKRQREQMIQEKGGEIDDVEEQDFYWNFNKGQKTSAQKIWKGYFKAPPGYIKPPKNQENAPHIKVSIDWVHGYRGNKCRNNMRYLFDGSICYHVAGLAVIQDPALRTQRHFDKHADDITAIAFGPNKKIVATGETGRSPSIFVWDAQTLRVLNKMQGQLRRGIKCLAFSGTGANLAACDISDDHQIAVFNVKSGACIAIQRGDKSLILGLAWRDDKTFATVGVKHFKLWTCDKTLTAKRGLWTGEQDRALTCVAFHGSSAFAGTAKGKLLKWEENRRVKSQTLHPGGLDAVTVHGGHLLTGGKDKRVAVVDPATLDLIMAVDLSKETAIRSIDARIRAVDVNSERGRLAVGTFGSEIFEVPFDLAAKTSDPLKSVALVYGHYAPKMRDTNEVWGLCSMPSDDGDQYVTVSEDGTLRVWNATTHEQLNLVNLNRHKNGESLPADPKTKEIALAAQARCVDVSGDGSLCAVGFRSGQFRVYDTTNPTDWKLRKAQKGPMTQWIEDLKFSPDDSKLAVSCHDTNVYVFETRKMELVCTLSECTSFVQHIDWSVDSRYLRTNDGSYELLFFDTATGKQVVHQPRAAGADKRAKESQDCTEYTEDQWHTANCTLTWASQGIWAHGMDGSDINHCDRSASDHPDGYKLLAAGDDFGKVKIFRYPSMNLASEATICRGHSSHVTKVKFTKSGHLISTGGNDAAVIQWKVHF